MIERLCAMLAPVVRLTSWCTLTIMSQADCFDLLGAGGVLFVSSAGCKAKIGDACQAGQ
jgi:hypothetical protein